MIENIIKLLPQEAPNMNIKVCIPVIINVTT